MERTFPVPSFCFVQTKIHKLLLDERGPVDEHGQRRLAAVRRVHDEALTVRRHGVVAAIGIQPAEQIGVEEWVRLTGLDVSPGVTSTAISVWFGAPTVQLRVRRGANAAGRRRSPTPRACIRRTGNVCTYTCQAPDSSNAYAIHRPSGDTWA